MPPDVDGPEPTVLAPHLESIDTAIDILKTELGLVHGNLDSIDRKAALLPPFLVALAGLMIPDGPYSDPQVALLAIAVVTGIVAVAMVLWMVFPGEVYLGPNAVIAARSAHHPPAEFKLASAISLANAVRDTSKATVVKGRWLRRSLRLAGVTILCLVLARIIAGGPVSEESAPAESAPTSTTAQPSAPAPTGQGEGSQATPAGTPPGTPISVPDLGQQIAIKGGEVPRNIETRIVGPDRAADSESFEKTT